MKECSMGIYVEMDFGKRNRQWLQGPAVGVKWGSQGAWKGQGEEAWEKPWGVIWYRQEIGLCGSSGNLAFYTKMRINSGLWAEWLVDSTHILPK